MSIIVMSITFDVKTALAGATTLALVQTELFGAAARLGVPLDIASAMNLIASTGVSIESIAHMARALRHSTTRSFLDAWKSIAPALTNGAFTTLAGLAPVAFARYGTFETFSFSTGASSSSRARRTASSFFPSRSRFSDHRVASSPSSIEKPSRRRRPARPARPAQPRVSRGTRTPHPASSCPPRVRRDARHVRPIDARLVARV